MASKQTGGAFAPDGSMYVTNTTGTGSLTGTSNGYPNGATPVTISAAGTTAATVATLPGAASKTTYLAGFSIGSTATAAVAGTCTVAGVVTGTMTFSQGVGAATSVILTTHSFNPPVPASAANTAIVVTSQAAGTAGVTNVNAWGYQL